ncbi:unnamed protein product [Paramecium primaurelia]|uniref:RING-type domain-containing protein n=1 Tax=Paramecium primaurelia TaxID=5886 RepID=A0A8S1JRE3_PARPR|nr:unnamed protein product [Paramecium primaurelia]
MKPINYNDDDELYNTLFYPNQRNKRSHTLITNPNNNNLQEQKLFAQQIKQIQKNFVRKLEIQKEPNKEQNKVQNIQNQSNQHSFGFFQPCNNILKNTQKYQPSLTQIQFKNEILPQPIHPRFKVQENLQFKKSQTLDICSVCFQPKDADHQCNDEYGFINCPYCSETIVRNFLDDHLVDCIPYIDHQFSNLDKKEECIICMEDLVKDKQTLKCSHSFHKSCIDCWIMKIQECPVCRKPI